MGLALRCFQRLSRPDLATLRLPLAGQQVHQRSVQPGPLVLGPAPLKSPTPAVDRDRHTVTFGASRVYAPTDPARMREAGKPFGLPLHVAVQVGLYLHLRATEGVWRTVSEGSR